MNDRYRELRKTYHAKEAFRISKKREHPKLYTDESHRIELPRGEYIEIKIRPDNSHQDEAIKLEELPYYTTRYANHGHLDREGKRVMVFYDNRSWGWLDGESSVTEYLPYLRKTHARHDAWLKAREQVKQDRMSAFRVVENGMYYWTVELFDAKGNCIHELTDSCGGYWDTDITTDEAFEQAEYMQQQRAEYWQTTLTNNRAETITLRATMRQLIKELRDIKPDTFTHQTMCEKLRALRAQQLGLITS